MPMLTNWNLGCWATMFILLPIILLFFLGELDLEKEYGCSTCLSTYIVISMYIGIAVSSVFAIATNDKKVAMTLYALMLIYKLTAYLIGDTHANSIVTRSNLAISPILAFSLYHCQSTRSTK